ncbi:hypothetical protein CCP3SC1_2190003 [Gammaproteobacteria bacterium]
MVGCAIGYAVVTSASTGNAAYSTAEFRNYTSVPVTFEFDGRGWPTVPPGGTYWFYGSALNLIGGSVTVTDGTNSVTCDLDAVCCEGGNVLHYTHQNPDVGGAWGEFDSVTETKDSWEWLQEGFLYSLPFMAFALTLIAVRKIARPSVEEL